MKHISFLKIATLLSVTSLLLAGCSMKKTDSSTNDTMMVSETAESQTPEVSQAPLSTSTEPDDLQKELEGTTISTEDFSDL